jgi:autophagy-related protein 9
VLTLGFIIGFSVFLLGFINWNEFSKCHDEESCGNSISKYILSSPFSYHSGFVCFLLVLYMIFFALYWLYNLSKSLQMIYSAFEMEVYYREKLNINLDDIQTITWSEIIARVLQQHNTNSYRIPNMKEFITEHDIVLRIMRKENYLIALINKQLLNIRVPWWAAGFMSENLFLTKSLEWSLSFCTLEYMFTEQFTISIDFLRNQSALEQRFYYLGLVHLALLPFMLIFMIIHFFLMNASLFHSNRAYLGPREWAPLALWTFREFNGKLALLLRSLLV